MKRRSIKNRSPQLFVLAAHPYPPESAYGTPQADFVRSVAHDLKAAEPIAVRVAAASLAPLVPRGATIVPVPGSRGSTRENLALAEAVAKLAGARVSDGLERVPSESQYARRKRGLAPLRAEAMNVRWGGAPLRGVVVLVDNVVTTGATAEAARRAIGGDVVVLAWADARGIHRSEVIVEAKRRSEKNPPRRASQSSLARDRRLVEYKVRIMRWHFPFGATLFCRVWYTVAEFTESDVAGVRAYFKANGITRDDFDKADKVRAFVGTRRIKRDGLDDRGWFD
mgnify:CR=1 FL=1